MSAQSQSDIHLLGSTFDITDFNLCSPVSSSEKRKRGCTCSQILIGLSQERENVILNLSKIPFFIWLLQHNKGLARLLH